MIKKYLGMLKEIYALTQVNPHINRNGQSKNAFIRVI